MSPDEIKTLIEEIRKNEIQYFWFYILLSILFGMISNFVLEYFKNKGGNIATKQDIVNITQKIESVKLEIYKSQEVDKLKRELKYNALLKSLNIIDAYLSNFFTFEGIMKQYASAEESRECYNNLILTCDNSEIIKSYENILMSEKSKDATGTQFVLTELENYRKLVRQELKFGKPIITNPDKIWIVNVPHEKP
jgi:Na+/phosphate symporter